MPILSKSSNSFREQLPDEETILLTRKHWIVLLGPALFLPIITTAPFLAYNWLTKSNSWLDSYFGPLFNFLAIVYLLALWTIVFYNIMIYSLNTLIVTNKRIIENKQLGFFKNIVNEIKLDKVQDVSVKTYGFLASLLNYGNIEVQSAGATNKFFFNQFPDPRGIKQIILSQR